jgi:molybdenum cofactor cytidylyltransferase
VSSASSNANNAGAGVAGIILAAGLSTRFGGNKLLAPLRGRALICRVVEAALASRLDRVTIVLGHERAQLCAALGDLLADPRLAAVVNENYRDGQSGSVIAGLEAVRRDHGAAMFLMGDQPGLGAATIDALIAAYDRTRPGICYPARDGRRRNPVIFAARFYPAILALTGDTGARALIDANRDAATAVAFAEEAQFRDVDRPDDLAAVIGGA